MKKFKLILGLLLASLNPAFCQVEMADTMRSDGKIYVVVAIVLIVLSGMILYLFLLDKKIKKLENLIKDKQHQTK